MRLAHICTTRFSVSCDITSRMSNEKTGIRMSALGNVLLYDTSMTIKSPTLSRGKIDGRQCKAVSCTLQEVKLLRMGGIHVFAIAHTCQRSGLGRRGNGRYCSSTHRGYSCPAGRTILSTHRGIRRWCPGTYERAPANTEIGKCRALDWL